MQSIRIVTTRRTVPPELWAQIIGYTKNHDLAHVWTRLRHVSRTFRQEIERNFSKSHLPKTIIHFFLMNWRMSGDDKSHSACIDTYLHFVRLSDDGQTAFFQLDKHFAAEADMIFEAIDRQSPEDINDAKQMVQIRNRVHDIYIPGLNVDKEMKEISFNWVNLYSIFFAERYTIDFYQEQWMLESAVSEEGMLPNWVPQDPIRNARKKARRHRIRRQSEEMTGKSMIFDKEYETVEAQSLGEIECVEYAAGFETYSDDEDADDLDVAVDESLWRWGVDDGYNYRMPDHFV